MAHILFCHGTSNRWQTAQRWLELEMQNHAHAWRQHKPHIVILAQDETQAQAFDQLLWTQPTTGFLPHCRPRSDALWIKETPIHILTPQDNAAAADILLNLSNDLPQHIDPYPQIMEIISEEDAVRLPARDRVLHYRAKGHVVAYRNLQKEDF